MKNAFAELYSGFKSLVIGMKITIGQFFKPTVTVHYPHEALKMTPRFRGHIELVRDPNTNIAKCFVCKLCEKACPSDCITVEGVKPEGGKRKTVTTYKLDFTKCSLCGECVEACRDDAIRFSREYNLAGLSKDEFVMDLFKRLEEQSRQEGVELVKPAEAAPAAAPVPPAAAPAPVTATAPAVPAASGVAADKNVRGPETTPALAKEGGA